MPLRRLVSVLSIAALPALAAPPDLLFPPGSVETLSTTADPGAYDLPTGKATPGDAPTARLEGRVTRQVIRVPGARGDSLALLQSLRDQLTGQGYEVVFSCATVACGGFDFRFATDVTPPPEMEVSLADFRQLSARAAGERYVSLLISITPRGGFVQATYVEPGSPPAVDLAPLASAEPAATADPATLAARLDRDGHAVLEGIAFNSGSAELDAAGKASLAELALLMTDRPDLRVAIVGHTDTDGPLDGNIAISRARARAVASALTRDHGIAADRLEAEGAGYLAPRASNATEEGRALNRRVEVVPR